MEIGCNYSEPLMKLLTGNKVKVDWIKLSRIEAIADELENVLTAIQRQQINVSGVLIHVLNDIGNENIIPTDKLSRHEIKVILARSKCPHIASHIWIDSRASKENFKTSGSFLRDHLVNYINENINKSMPLISPCKLLLENCPYHGDGILQNMIVDPLFYNTIHVQNPNVNLLLDIAHARITSHFLRKAVDEYINGFFIDTVKEIHVSGVNMPYEEEGKHVHVGMDRDDYDILRRVLHLASKTDIITLEYGGTGKKYLLYTPNDQGQLKEQLDEIRNIT